MVGQLFRVQCPKVKERPFKYAFEPFIDNINKEF